jgi:hypothetical protein
MALLALIPLAAKLLGIASAVPDVLRVFGGKKQADVAEKLVSVAKAVTGLDDPENAVEAVIKDPALQLQYQQSLIAERQFFAQLEADDRKDARAMFVATRARTPAVLSWVVVIGFFGVTGFLLKYGQPSDLDDLLLGRLLGTLDAAFATVLAFWLGSSFGSRQKDELK